MREVSGLTHFLSLTHPLTVHRTLRSVHRTLLAEAAAVTLAGVRRFQFRLLAGRDEVSVLLEIFDDLLRDHFALETAQRALDRFVRIY